MSGLEMLIFGVIMAILCSGNRVFDIGKFCSLSDMFLELFNTKGGKDGPTGIGNKEELEKLKELFEKLETVKTKEELEKLKELIKEIIERIKGPPPTGDTTMPVIVEKVKEKIEKEVPIIAVLLFLSLIFFCFCNFVVFLSLNPDPVLLYLLVTVAAK